MGKFFKVPWGTSGDRATAPDAVQPDGSASWSEGFGADYELDPATNPAARPVPRDLTNGILYEITAALAEIQLNGVALWTTDATPYPVKAMVRHSDTVWRSLVANNSVEPAEGANWTEVGPVAAATETVAGILRRASASETAAGTVSDAAVTPAGLKPLVAALAPLANPTFTGTVNVPTPGAGDSSQRAAPTGWVRSLLSSALSNVQAALGFTPVQQGGGFGMGSDKVYLGWSGSQLLGQVGATPLGAVLFSSADAGQVAYFATDAAPAGWLIANGAEVSRTTYAALFARIGTKFGAGNGNSTFNLPNLLDTFVKGSGASRAVGTTQAQQVPSHYHGTGQYSLPLAEDNWYAITRPWSEGPYTGRRITGDSDDYSVASISGNSTSGNTQATATTGPVGVSGENSPANTALLPCIRF